MKEVKLLGQTDRWGKDIQAHRVEELELSKKARILSVYRLVISVTLACFARIQEFLVEDDNSLVTASNQTHKDGSLITHGLDLKIQRSTLTMIIGRIGSGKSTLLKGLIGELPTETGCALARAIYSRRDVAIIDDMLSGLDRSTEELVWNNVFGPRGIFRQYGVTVILATHTILRVSSSGLD
ncbi:putative Uncharacterized ABC transporter ATP-binding protein/permease [Glarea lozoyensis 74030]|uniref:Putative Uncharacterized ABC transporter ATP-binding protein/permease n=1 Tax=Glarea lozoyensis (strain ATCC 74030 / MF5533) TaxID=1104152 RepID=H0EHP9_GLAL7|nr:putative Uncharacterized ABC transporter ATP-binding protein/permease [Glarea lozoyensis 74030]